MRLGKKLQVELQFTGEVVGRTFERDPKVDLKTPWGMLIGVPISVLQAGGSAAPEGEAEIEVPANVTQIADALRNTAEPTRKAG